VIQSAFLRSVSLLVSLAALPAAAMAQQPPAKPAVPAGATLPSDYVIGPEDVLVIVFWRDEKMGGEVVVRPDGRISQPLLNDVDAAGLTPEQLRVAIDKAATKFVAEPNATVVVKTINSRKVHIVGNVLRPNTYPLTGDMNVLQPIALAGGLQEYADAKNITIIRKESGKDRPLKFNFKDVSRGKNLQQNVQLKPGDTVVVP
jgi:polysaccharide export outer membrane protein